jgi:hypothetical protein
MMKEIGEELLELRNKAVRIVSCTVIVAIGLVAFFVVTS